MSISRHLKLGAMVVGVGLALCGCSATAATPAPSAPTAPTAASAPHTSEVAGTEGRGEDVVVVQADYPTYQTAAQVGEAAEVSVVGRITAVREQIGDLNADPAVDPKPSSSDAPSDRLPYTVYTVAVDRVIHGTAKSGSEIEFSVIGGTMDGQRYELGGAPALQVDPEATLIVNLGGTGRYPGLINLSEGVFTLQGGQAVPLNPTELTAAELEKVAKAATSGRG